MYNSHKDSPVYYHSHTKQQLNISRIIIIAICLPHNRIGHNTSMLNWSESLLKQFV